MQNKSTQNEPLVVERVIAAASYISSGWIGFFWLIIAFYTKNRIRPFLKFHVFQSIFISFLFFILSVFVGLITNGLGIIPGFGGLMLNIAYFFNKAVFFNFSLIQTIMIALNIYLAVMSLFGEYGRVPWVSDIIKENVR